MGRKKDKHKNKKADKPVESPEPVDQAVPDATPDRSSSDEHTASDDGMPVVDDSDDGSSQTEADEFLSEDESEPTDPDDFAH